MKWETAKGSDTPKKGKGRGCLIAVVVVIVIAIIGGISRCGGKKSESLDWPTSGLAAMLPKPSSSKGTVIIDNAETFDASIDEWEKSDYDDYVEQCKGKGFTVDAVDDGDGYEAYTEDGHHLELSFYDGLEQMSLRLEAPIEMSEISWPTAGAGALLPAPTSTTGQIAVDSSSQFTVYVGKTDADAYSAYVEECIEAGFDVDYSRGDNYFNADDASGNSLRLEYRGFNIMYVRLYAADLLEEAEEGANEEPEISDESSEPEQSEAPEAPVESDSSDFRAMIDEYEAFMNEYCDFMEEYNSDSSNVVSMAMDYANMLAQYGEWVEKMDAVDENALSAEDAQYYIDAQTRINKRMLEIGLSE